MTAAHSLLTRQVCIMMRGSCCDCTQGRGFTQHDGVQLSQRSIWRGGPLAELEVTSPHPILLVVFSHVSYIWWSSAMFWPCVSLPACPHLPDIFSYVSWSSCVMSNSLSHLQWSIALVIILLHAHPFQSTSAKCCILGHCHSGPILHVISSHIPFMMSSCTISTLSALLQQCFAFMIVSLVQPSWSFSVTPCPSGHLPPNLSLIFSFFPSIAMLSEVYIHYGPLQPRKVL